MVVSRVAKGWMEKLDGRGLQQGSWGLEGSQCRSDHQSIGYLEGNGWEATCWEQPNLDAVKQPNSGFQHRKTGTLIKQIVEGQPHKSGFEGYLDDIENRV